MRNRRHRMAPAWVQVMPDREAHALAGRLIRDLRTGDLSRSQEWLLTRVLGDLEWRRNEALRRRRFPCSCWLCVPPDWD